MNQNGEQCQQGEDFREGGWEEACPDLPGNIASDSEKTDHIDDIERQDDCGSTDQNEGMYAVAS